MNKKVILKYKDVFDWWLNGGKVWSRLADNYIGWDIREPNWNEEDIYVQDDEYAEFRKALADGKTIEYCTNRSGKVFAVWETMRRIDYFNKGANYYRIKPDEPKFKVGDWVRIDDPVTMSYICKFRKDTYRVFEGDLDCIIKWKPQDGDVVVCLDQPTPRIFEVNHSNKSFVNDQFRYKKILPYIGQPLGEMK